MARTPMTDQGKAGDRQRVTTYVKPELWKRVRLLAVERTYHVGRGRGRGG